MIRATYFGRRLGWFLESLDEASSQFLDARYISLPHGLLASTVGGYFACSAIAGRLAIDAASAGLEWRI